MTVDKAQIDFRVSTPPAYHGESQAGIRLTVRIGIQNPPEEEDYKASRRSSRPNGIFLVTGPTGSGKTTTLIPQRANRPTARSSPPRTPSSTIRRHQPVPGATRSG
jgi:type IV pilus assembly protein PilB